MILDLWITMLIPDYSDTIITQLVNNGYSVIPHDPSNIITKGEQSTVFAVAVDTPELEIAKDKVEDFNLHPCNYYLDDIQELLAEKKIKYYSIIVNGKDGSGAWNTGEFDYDKEDV